jgi:radical SAM protein with 4Fe4S-binding SPASM domain
MDAKCMNPEVPLREVSIEITRKCLQDCVHCSSVAGRNATESISQESFFELVDEISSLGGETVQISGGEPLLHENVFEFISYCKKKNLQVELFTCGKTMDGNTGLTLEEVIVNLGVHRPDKIVISIHGSNAETHDSIARTQGSFNLASSLAKELVKCNHQVELHFVPMTPNLEELEDLVKHAKQLGVNKVSILRFVPQGRGERYKEHLLPSSEEVTTLVEALSHLKKREGDFIGVGSHLDFLFIHSSGNEPKKCQAGRDKCLIETNGNVIPCAVFKGRSDYVVDNVKDKPLHEIWCSAGIFQRFRDFSYEMLIGMCAGCDDVSKCEGRCPGQRVYDWNDFYKGPDKCCPKRYYRKVKKQKKVSNQRELES